MMKLFRRSKLTISDSIDSDDNDKYEKSLLKNENKVESINRRRRAITSGSSDYMMIPKRNFLHQCHRHHKKDLIELMCEKMQGRK